MNKLMINKIKESFRSEISQDFSSALIELQDLRSISDGLEIEYLIDNFFDRLFSMEAYESLKIEPYKIYDNNPCNYNNSVKDSPLISLTCIESRLSGVVKTINSIRSQSLEVHSINLYVSDDAYLIDKGVLNKRDTLDYIHSLGVNVYLCDNIGPYRKQFPIVKQLRECLADENTVVITIDDDVVYPDNIISDLYNRIKEIQCVVAHRGRKIQLVEDKVGPYKSFEAAGQEVDLLNLATGKNGIAYLLKFFPKEKKYFDLYRLCPTADDIWCKWITANYLVETSILEPRAAFEKSLDFQEVNPESKQGLYHVYNSRGTNDIAIRCLEEFFTRGGTGYFGLAGKYL